ncbi:hypothetical protein [Megasphaera sp.]|uniref:hypothetical protein n=1 Tax=Megasphaera sp. TaxID=2023260 RepID=UPI004025A4EB
MINDKMAKMAVNTLKKYCKNLCSRCAVYGSCGQRYCYFENVDGYNDVGTFEDLQKSIGKPPKFDIRQKDSAAFRNYINKIFMEEAEKYGLPMNTANSIKWTARGTIVVTFVDDDSKTNYIGWAKCHPNDAFNPEVGIKLAIERAAQAMKAPFVPEENEAYYYAGDENRIYSTINHHTNTDILNIAVGNCFRKRKEAHANKEAIRKRVEKSTKLLEKLRDEGDE